MLKVLCVHEPQMSLGPRVLTVVNFVLGNGLWVFAVGTPARLCIPFSLKRQETYNRRRQPSLPRKSKPGLGAGKRQYVGLAAFPLRFSKLRKCRRLQI